MFEVKILLGSPKLGGVTRSLREGASLWTSQKTKNASHFLVEFVQVLGHVARILTTSIAIV